MSERTARGALTAIALTYAAVIFSHISRVAGGPDTSGYLNEARLIASGRASLPITPLRTLMLDARFAHLFVPFGFTTGVDPQTLVPLYPAGLSFHLVAFGFLVSPLAAIACLILSYFVARELGLSERASLVAAVIVAVSPPLVYIAIQAASDVLVTAWTLVAMLCALRAQSNKLYAFGAGAAFAISVWVRPSNLLIVLALVVALRFHPRQLVGAAIGAAPLMIALLFWNAHLYGSPFRAGYGDVGYLFSWDFFRAHLPAYSYWLMALHTPIVFPGGLLGMRKRPVLLAWFVPLFLFYCAYGAYAGWDYTRFLLPALPSLIFGTLLVIDRVERRWIFAIVAAVLIAVPLRASFLRVHRFDESVYPKTIQLSRTIIPRDAIVVTGLFSGAYLYYTGELTARWDEMRPEEFAELRARTMPRPWYAVLVKHEIPGFLRHLPGTWTDIGHVDDAVILRVERMPSPAGRGWREAP